MPACFNTIHDGHHDIKKNKIGQKFPGYIHRFFSVFGRSYFKVQFGKVILKYFQNIGFIIYNKDFFFSRSCFLLFKSKRNFYPLSHFLGFTIQ
jgi:hypothetical protein